MNLSTLLLTGLLLFPVPSKRAEAGAGEAGEPRLRVSASIYPISMLVEEIGGNRVDVTTMIPPGVDPHHFELTPSSAKAVGESRVVFMIGGGFDSWAPGEVQLAPAARSQSREPAPGGKAEQRAGLEEAPVSAFTRVEFHRLFPDSLIDLGHTFNPHFWLDPLLARKMGEFIGLTLIGADPAGRPYYEKRMLAFAARVDSLHESVRERLAETGIKAYVSFHPAWTYFGRRYGLREAGVVEKFPEHEPSARWVADLIREIESQGVKIMIVEMASDPGVVRGIAGDTGVRVLVLDPIGDPGAPGRNTYPGLIDYNVSVIERAAREGE
jgi:zinc transport system substrate-binding protein